MNVEKWFEDGTGLKIKKLRYLKPPKIPYFLYVNRKNNRGADLRNNILENNITIERYSSSNGENDKKEIEKVNQFLEKNNYEYEFQTEWLESEELYGNFWILEPIIEKIRKDEENYG